MTILILLFLVVLFTMIMILDLKALEKRNKKFDQIFENLKSKINKGAI